MEEHHAYLALMLRLARRGAEDFDLVVDNSLHHLPVAMAQAVPVPMVTILHTPPVPWLESAVDLSGSTGTFIAVSAAMSRAWAHAVTTRTVLNGVDPSRWPAGPGGPDAVWSGRIAPEKAPHDAIDAARLSGRAIALAGPVMDRGYFDTEIRPRLGSGARYVGHLDQRALATLVGASGVALVTPAWDEPFGLVAAEAMLCGTPVAAYARGGLLEVVAPETGRLASSNDPAGLARAIDAAALLDRTAVREHAEGAHGLTRMVDAYERLFEDMLAEAAAA